MIRKHVGYVKVSGIIALLFAGLFAAGFTSADSNSTKDTSANSREIKIQKEVYSQLLSFQNYVKDTLLIEVGKARPDEQSVRQAFLKSRLLFKKFEWASEYFTADLSRRLNGPPVEEIENADLLDPSLARAIDPIGLQVIEEMIYPEYDQESKEKLLTEVRHLISNTDYLISYFHDQQFADWRILDASKLEVFRIITLGITGFDNSIALNSIPEAAESLKSLRDVLSLYANKKGNRALLSDLDAAITYLDRHPDFNSFDRAVFITQFGNKVSAGIAKLEQDLPGPKIKYNRMLRQEAKTLFDANAFNADAFAPGPEFQRTAAKASLGEKLFFDAALSGNGSRSCATCHNPNLAFTDGIAKQTEVNDPIKLLTRNAPTLLNAALQSNYFYDMRALTLEDQVRDVISSKQEMDGSMAAIIKYVAADKSYPSLFAKAFSGNIEKGISADQVTNALAVYIRSLVKLNSRFDEYMSGNENALSAEELKGFNLFMGKAKCATCHFAPLFNGVTPPKYITSESEVLGVPVSPADATLDADVGYYGVIGIDAYKHAFKIPTIRNIKKTAPYMHNGAYQTLDEVMEFYNKGGAAGLGIKLPNQTLPEENLQLSDKEKKDIIAFMESLESK
ncbi:cytochrome c peroxidase [Pedobacter gandavensis]|uniref:cytochrome-c peroxidase n=1 Tax=Pedobacter gandavensis TaxID=2679963 RepID=UPI002479214C|nr:cytochrome c peroxidase [Pedobacter gandavensis]WGQ10560.1 cytochrome c peroxidase [Pedobacter gandavensis]